MIETNFFQSWAFWLLAGIVIGFIVGFALAIILAASSRASRMEERMSDDKFYHHIAKFKNNWKPEIEMVGYKPPPKKNRRPKKPTPAPPPKIETVKQNDPRTD